MGAFKELDPELVWRMIEGQPDELTPEEVKLSAYYRQFKCPRGCGELRKEFDSRHAFSDPDTLVARALLRCPNCQYLVDPFTNIVLESGSPAKMPTET